MNKLKPILDEAIQGIDKKPTSLGYKDYMEVEKASKDMKTGGKVSSASKRADGIAIRGKTKA